MNTLTESLRQRVERLAEEPLQSLDELKEEVEEYLLTARAAIPQSVGLAERIASRALDLALSCQSDERSRRLAQAAIKYLVQSDDEVPDFDSPEGLEDDAQVFNAIAASLGRADLVIPR